MITRQQFLSAVKLIEEYKRQINEQYLKDMDKINDCLITEDSELDDIGVNLSVRAYNILKSIRINKIGDLKEFTLLDISHFRGAGVAVQLEIQKLCKKAGFEIKKK